MFFVVSLRRSTLCNYLLSVLIFVLLMSLFVPHAFALSLAPWMNPSLTPDQRADQLLARMTLDEKIALLHGVAGSRYGGYVPANLRLGIPALALEDGPAGV